MLNDETKSQIFINGLDEFNAKVDCAVLGALDWS